MPRQRTYTCCEPGCTQPKYKKYWRCEEHQKAYWNDVNRRKVEESIVIVGFTCPACGVRRARINGQPAYPCWQCGAKDGPPAPRGGSKIVVQEEGNSHPTEITVRDDGTMSVHHNKGMLADRFAQIAADEDAKTVKRIQRMLDNMLYGDVWTDGTLTIALLAKPSGTGRVSTRRYILLRGDNVIEPNATAAQLLAAGWQHTNVQAARLAGAQDAAAWESVHMTIAAYQRKRA